MKHTNEYTNYSALRKRKHQRRFCISVILMFCLIAGTSVAVRVKNAPKSSYYLPPQHGTSEETPPPSITVDITAANACVMSAEGKQVVFETGSDERIAPASTAKMLVALTVLDYYWPGDALTVGDEIDLMASDSSRAWLNAGDKLSVQQMLVALLLPSGNDAAYTLAVNTGRLIAKDDSLSSEECVEAFMKAANKKAKSLGANDSNFLTPDGYDAEGQYTTAYDLALIAAACLENDCISEIVGSFMIQDTWLSGREVTYYNTNELINPDGSYYYPNAVGLKTGSSSQAGECLVSAAIINGELWVCVIMGAVEEGRYTDSLKVYNELET